MPVSLWCALGLSLWGCGSGADTTTAEGPVPGLAEAPPTTAGPAAAGADRPKAAGGRGPGLAEPTRHIQNPASGATLAVYVDHAKGRSPLAIVMSPPGVEAGGEFAARAVATWTQAGITVVRYDPDGRGHSTGEEDRGGAHHKAALAAVVAHARGLDGIEHVGLVSYSAGIVPASAVAADPDSGIAWWIDWEGPTARQWMAGCTADDPGKLHDGHRCDDEAYWAEHEALTGLAGVQVPYLRVQSAQDHVHKSDWGHARLAVETAVAGGAAWVRLNDGPVNPDAAALDAAVMPDSPRLEREAILIDHAKELFALAQAP